MIAKGWNASINNSEANLSEGTIRRDYESERAEITWHSPNAKGGGEFVRLTLFTYGMNEEELAEYNEWVARGRPNLPWKSNKNKV